MKNYEVRMTMLVAVTVSVEAENEEAAEKLAMEKTGREEAYYPSKYDSVWEREVVEVNECEPEEEKTELQKAIEYVRDNMDEDDMAILQAEMNKCYKANLIPGENVMDCDKVLELLDQYGEENDLPERWWESECEIDEILCEL